MNPRRAWAVALRQLYLLRGSSTRIASLGIWVTVDMILWGFLTKYLNLLSGPEPAKINFVPLLLGAVLLWDYFTRVMLGVTTAFFEDVWSHNFLNIFASPLRISEYLGGFVISSIITSSFGLVLMLVLAMPLFGLSFFSFGWLLLPFLLELFLFGVALGIAATAMVLRLGPSSEWLIWPLPFLLSPLAGVFYPVSILPYPLPFFSRLLPPSYVFENMRLILGGHTPSLAGLVTGAVLCMGYLMLAAWVWKRTYDSARKSGLLARYGAESTS